MTTTEEMQIILKTLNLVRKQANESKAAFQSFINQFYGSKEYIDLAMAASKDQERLELVEKSTRDIADGMYEETKNKNLAPGLEMKEDTTIEIVDEPLLVAWCEHNYHSALTVDPTKIKKVIKAELVEIPEHMVKVTKKLKAYISRDLDKYYPE